MLSIVPIVWHALCPSNHPIRDFLDPVSNVRKLNLSKTKCFAEDYRAMALSLLVAHLKYILLCSLLRGLQFCLGLQCAELKIKILNHQTKTIEIGHVSNYGQYNLSRNCHSTGRLNWNEPFQPFDLHLSPLLPTEHVRYVCAAVT